MQIISIIEKYKLILSRHQKIRVFELGVLMIIGGLLETCSVSLILPFMNIVMNPEKTMANQYVKLACGILGIQSDRTFLVFLAVVLAAVYILKNAYLLFEYNVQYRFVYGNMFQMQKRLLSNFVNRPYEYFLSVNSGEVIRIINNDTGDAFNLLCTLLNMFTELIVSGMLIISVFIIAPTITILITVALLFMVILLNYVLKPILRKAGVENQRAVTGMNKWLLQSIQGIKELKVLGKESFFVENYSIYGKRYISTVRKNYILGIVPRFFIEGISMGMMFILVAILIYSGAELESIVPVLSAVALAAVRLMPSVNRITNALSSGSYNESRLDRLIENLKNISGEKNICIDMDLSGNEVRQPVYGGDINFTESKKIEAFRHEIRLNNITYHYPESTANVLDKASLSIFRGQSVGIVGTTGTGKTTAVDLMLGFLNPQEGEVLIDGVDIKNDMPGFLNQVGYIPQSMFMLNGTIRENVAFGEKEIDDNEVMRALTDVSLIEFVLTLPDGVNTQIGEQGIRLSGGQRQRIGIARALYHNPSILVFDEATSALDNETEKYIMDSINTLKGKKTMIIIAHRLTTIEQCDVVYKVEGGKFVKERGI